MKTKKQILWITQTALFIAILITTQVMTRPYGTIITGTMVNTILVLTTILVGLSSGITLALISPFLATMFGIVYPLVELIPLIAIGNSIIVLGAHFAKIITKKQTRFYYPVQIVFTMIGGALKALFLFISIVLILVPFLDLSPAKASAISSAFSLPQLITALLGSLIAVSIYRLLKKQINH